MTTPFFLLRCVQLELSIRDLELLSIGLKKSNWITMCMSEATSPLNIKSKEEGYAMKTVVKKENAVKKVFKGVSLVSLAVGGISSGKNELCFG